VKIVADQAKLSQKLQAVGAVVPTKTTLTILSNVLLQAEGDQLKLTATDLDLSMTTSLAAQVEQPGNVCVQARRFIEIIRALPPADVKLSVRADTVRIQCGKSDFKIKGADSDEYPKVTDRMKEKGFAVPAATLNRMIDRVGHAVSQDLSRVALTGVLWEFEKSGFSMVATDGSRLSKTSHPEKVANPATAEIIVPGKALHHVQRLMNDAGDVKITVSDSYIGFDLGDTFLHSRLLEGPFPNYRPVIPKNNQHKMTVERDGLTQATRRVSILANTLTHQIKMGLRPDAVSLSVATPDLGEAQEDIVAAYNGPEMDIGFNANFLLDILKSIDSDDVEFDLDQADTAAMIHPVNGKEDEKFFCLLMPLRLAE
jgi:DNA polymerase-3 subunit beta